MSMKSGNVIEQHIVKIVLAVAGVLCLWLLVTHVFISPNKVPYGGERFGPEGIDQHIHETAQALDDKLRSPAKAKEPYAIRRPEFVRFMDSTVKSGTELGPLSPRFVLSERTDGIKYDLPQIGGVEQVEAEHIRAVAYVPTVVVDTDRAYTQNDSEPNDVDLVTVEAKFDVAQLYERFYDSFAGYNVREEWRDPCLAAPVFAAVQLQRQQLLADGSWSDWQDIPRTHVEYRKEMFEAVAMIERPSPAEVKMNLYKFDDPEVRMGLLQPDTYVIASAEEEWFPPLLHREYVDGQRRAEAQEKRKVLEEGKKNDERRRGGPRYYGRDRSSYGEGERGVAYRGGRERGPSTGRGRGPYVGREREEMEEMRTTRISRGASETKWLDDLYEEFGKVLITSRTDLAKMSEQLVFWAHDDTIAPGNSYRYRIRYGVFNPVAGTNQVSQPDESRRDQLILWSEFSEMTEPVEIPATLYFFPMRAQEAIKQVMVKVSKYVLGYWYGKAFPVQSGEVIGKVIEHDASETKTGAAKLDLTLPETIDYATGAVLVDVTTVSDWSGEKNLTYDYYPDMLYSYDGTVIEHMPVAMINWSMEQQGIYRELDTLEKRPKQPLRSWASTADRYRQRTGRRRVDVDKMIDEEEEDWRSLEEMEQHRRMFGDR
ncbi:MAG: hypothetical protein ACYTEL_05420 [Planctomycetota bacterium]|jgi:hypothetical protein